MVLLVPSEIERIVTLLNDGEMMPPQQELPKS